MSGNGRKRKRARERERERERERAASPLGGWINVYESETFT